jgi:hypothetical protein
MSLNFSSELRCAFEQKKHDLENAINRRNISDIKNIRNKLCDTLNNFSIDMLILNIFNKQCFTTLQKEIKYEIDRSKFALKFDQLNSKYINISDQIDEPRPKTIESDLVDLLVTEHLFERMVAFGHSFDKNDEPKFLFTVIKELDGVYRQLGYHAIDEQVGFLQSQKGLGLVLRIQGNFQNGRHQHLFLDDMSVENIEQVFSQNDLSKIQILFPAQFLTIQELIDREVVERNSETGTLSVSPFYQYLERGFIEQCSVGWKHLEPYCASAPPSTFLVNILAHLPKQGGIGAQGHASAQLITPSGDTYSVGFLPKGSENDPIPESFLDHLKEFEIKKAVLESPDHCIFLPTTAYDTKQIAFSIDDPKNFHTLFDFVESARGYNETGEGTILHCNAFYQRTHLNCAAFVDALGTLAINLGAKRIKSPVISSFESTKVALQGLFFELFCHLPIVKQHSNDANDEIKREGFDGLTLSDLTNASSILPATLLNKYATI